MDTLEAADNDKSRSLFSPREEDPSEKESLKLIITRKVEENVEIPTNEEKGLKTVKKPATNEEHTPVKSQSKSEPSSIISTKTDVPKIREAVTVESISKESKEIISTVHREIITEKDILQNESLKVEENQADDLVVPLASGKIDVFNIEDVPHSVQENMFVKNDKRIEKVTEKKVILPNTKKSNSPQKKRPVESLISQSVSTTRTLSEPVFSEIPTSEVKITDTEDTDSEIHSHKLVFSQLISKFKTLESTNAQSSQTVRIRGLSWSAQKSTPQVSDEKTSPFAKPEQPSAVSSIVKKFTETEANDHSVDMDLAGQLGSKRRATTSQLRASQTNRVVSANLEQYRITARPSKQS